MDFSDPKILGMMTGANFLALRKSLEAQRGMESQLQELNARQRADDKRRELVFRKLLSTTESCPHCSGRIPHGYEVCMHCHRDVIWNQKLIGKPGEEDELRRKKQEQDKAQRIKAANAKRLKAQTQARKEENERNRVRVVNERNKQRRLLKEAGEREVQWFSNRMLNLFWLDREVLENIKKEISSKRNDVVLYALLFVICLVFPGVVYLSEGSLSFLGFENVEMFLANAVLFYLPPLASGIWLSVEGWRLCGIRKKKALAVNEIIQHYLLKGPADFSPYKSDPNYLDRCFDTVFASWVQSPQRGEAADMILPLPNFKDGRPTRELVISYHLVTFFALLIYPCIGLFLLMVACGRSSTWVFRAGLLALLIGWFLLRWHRKRKAKQIFGPKCPGWLEIRFPWLVLRDKEQKLREQFQMELERDEGLDEELWA